MATAKQIAAQKLFAERARSGAFKRTRKSAAKKRKANPLREVFVNLPSGGKHPHDEWVSGRTRSGGWNTSPDFADALVMSDKEAAKIKAHCQRVRVQCEVVPIEKANPKRRSAAPAQPNPRARKVTHVELDSTGDHFGADQTTIQLWHLRPAETKRAYRSFRIPASVVKNADFQAWARGMNYVLSMNYRQMVEKLRKFA